MISKRELMKRILRLEMNMKDLDEKFEARTKFTVVKKINEQFCTEFSRYIPTASIGLKEVLSNVLEILGYELEYNKGQREIKPSAKMVKEKP